MPKSRAYYFIGAIVLALIILYFRNPQLFTHPQFWAEDGRVWFQEAHNFGFFSSVIRHQDGYFQTFARLVASTASLFPLRYAPRIFSFASIAMFLLPALFILSKRFKSIISFSWGRILLFLLYVVLPNTAELHGNLTNAQWYLGLLVALILVSEKPKSIWGKVFDVAALVLCALSGPFGIIIGVFGVLLWWFTKNNYTLLQGVLLLSFSLAQVGSLFVNGGRPGNMLGANVGLFFEILSKQVLSGLLLGSQGYLWFSQHMDSSAVLFVILACLGLVVMMYQLDTGSWNLRFVVIFGVAIFFATLASPTVAQTGNSPWQLLLDSYAGARYWLIPMFAFALVVVVSLHNSNPLWIRLLSSLLLSLSLIGIIFDFKDPPLPDLEYAKYMREYNHAAIGSIVRIPINPLGSEDWTMRLVKK